MTGPGQQGEVAANLAAVRDRIAAAARPPARAAAVTLVAVAKSQPEERIEAALAAGQRVFGENYVQEALRRWPGLRRTWPGVELHLIGHLQSNKAPRRWPCSTRSRPTGRSSPASSRRDGAPGRRACSCRSTRRGAAEVGRGRASPTRSSACRGELGLAVEGLMAIPPEDDDVALHTALLQARAAPRARG